MLGEHKISSDPDCPAPRKRGVFRNGKNKNCFAKVIRRRVDKIINHENYDPTKIKNDIALIRLAEPVPLFKDDPKGSPAMPICLPWDDNLAARNLRDGNKTLYVCLFVGLIGFCPKRWKEGIPSLGILPHVQGRR